VTACFDTTKGKVVSWRPACASPCPICHRIGGPVCKDLVYSTKGSLSEDIDKLSWP
jgi:hypothetical protein